MAHAMEVDHPDRIICSLDGRLHTAKHSRRDDQHRNSVRIRDRLRRSDRYAPNESKCQSAIPRAAGAAGSHSRHRDLSAVDVLAAGRELVPADYLAVNWIGDLL